MGARGVVLGTVFVLIVYMLIMHRISYAWRYLAMAPLLVAVSVC